MISSFERDRKEGAVEHSFLLAHYLCTKARVYMHVSRCSVSALCAGPLSLVVRRPDDRTGWRQRKTSTFGRDHNEPYLFLSGSGALGCS